MRTTGLGGDPEVHGVVPGLAGGLRLGPRRQMPLALAAVQFPTLVHEMLDTALGMDAAPTKAGALRCPCSPPCHPACRTAKPPSPSACFRDRNAWPI
ncbi:MAG: hypothetical protein R3D60_06355 [Paracoccaceae bacterium]